jgi:NAD(P)-dependent dehydrogenase (short-subunit alcohol dehydrogenase family)
MSSTLAASIVLISGGNLGLGLATVKALLLGNENRSYTIYMGSRSLERAHEAIKGFEADPALSAALKAGSSKVIPVQLDVEDDKSIEAAHEKLAQEAGRVDVLINNAGDACST